MTTKIEWCDETWNPITGCSSCSPGCDHCYARQMAQRLKGRFGYPADDPFRVTFHEDQIERPFRWKKSRRIFVCSMGDLFHEEGHRDWPVAVWDTMFDCPQHTFLVLTKRPLGLRWFATRMKEHLFRKVDYPNIHLGVTVCNQAEASAKIPILLATPAAVRWVSIEPTLGTVDLAPYLPRLDWVVLGPENGPGARPMDLDWARSVRDQCAETGTPFFFKGGALDGHEYHEFPEA